MSDIAALTVEKRDGRGSRAAAKLRKQGKIPAVVYGHKQEPVSIAVNYDELDRAVRVLHARVFDLKLDGTSESVLLKDLQWDHLGSEMIHADFARVSRDEKVKVTVPVKLKNAPKSTGGGVLDQPLHTLHIECPAISIPDDVTIDITDLTLGHPIHVRELPVPAGATILDPAEAVVVQLKLPGASETATALPGAEPVQPEVIKKEKKAEDADE
jgi:large subunit ribosomal protein L25